MSVCSVPLLHFAYRHIPLLNRSLLHFAYRFLSTLCTLQGILTSITITTVAACKTALCLALSKFLYHLAHFAGHPDVHHHHHRRSLQNSPLPGPFKIPLPPCALCRAS